MFSQSIFYSACDALCSKVCKQDMDLDLVVILD